MHKSVLQNVNKEWWLPTGQYSPRWNSCTKALRYCGGQELTTAEQNGFAPHFNYQKQDLSHRGPEITRQGQRDTLHQCHISLIYCVGVECACVPACGCMCHACVRMHLWACVCVCVCMCVRAGPTLLNITKLPLIFSPRQGSDGVGVRGLERMQGGTGGARSGGRGGRGALDILTKSQRVHQPTDLADRGSAGSEA